MKRLLLASLLIASVTSLVWCQEPIRERIEWADIWVTDADKDDLPRVLLIGEGDTITAKADLVKKSPTEFVYEAAMDNGDSVRVVFHKVKTERKKKAKE